MEGNFKVHFYLMLVALLYSVQVCDATKASFLFFSRAHKKIKQPLATALRNLPVHNFLSNIPADL